jgi:ribosomal 30S subunit maturation factor RimM
LALADDRPELQEDEFYTRDLVGVEVVLKGTGQVIGTVVDVYSVGARDLLKVKRSDLEASGM